MPENCNMKKLPPMPLFLSAGQAGPKGLFKNFLFSGFHDGWLQRFQNRIATRYEIKMKSLVLIFSLFFLSITLLAQQPAKKFVLVIHGGAGTI